jgi:hypothetical protein
MVYQLYGEPEQIVDGRGDHFEEQHESGAMPRHHEEQRRFCVRRRWVLEPKQRRDCPHTHAWIRTQMPARAHHM